MFSQLKLSMTEWATSYSSNETVAFLRKFNYQEVLKCSILFLIPF